VGTVYNSLKTVSDGNIVHLDAANKRSYNGSGVTWLDLSKNNNNGTLENGTKFITSKPNYFSFDGVNDDMYVTSSFFTSVPQVFTLEFCHYDLGSGCQFICRGNTGEGWSIENRTFRIFNHPSSYDLISTPYTTANKFYHTVCILNGTSFKRYVNNVLMNDITLSSTFRTNTNTNKMYVNVDIGSSGSVVPGSYRNSGISIIRVYDRILNVSEINQNYLSVSGRYGI